MGREEGVFWIPVSEVLPMINWSHGCEPRVSQSITAEKAQRKTWTSHGIKEAERRDKAQNVMQLKETCSGSNFFQPRPHSAEPPKTGRRLRSTHDSVQ